MLKHTLLKQHFTNVVYKKFSFIVNRKLHQKQVYRAILCGGVC